MHGEEKIVKLMDGFLQISVVTVVIQNLLQSSNPLIYLTLMIQGKIAEKWLAWRFPQYFSGNIPTALASSLMVPSSPSPTSSSPPPTTATDANNSTEFSNGNTNGTTSPSTASSNNTSNASTTNTTHQLVGAPMTNKQGVFTMLLYLCNLSIRLFYCSHKSWYMALLAHYTVIMGTLVQGALLKLFFTTCYMVLGYLFTWMYVIPHINTTTGPISHGWILMNMVYPLIVLSVSMHIATFYSKSTLQSLLKSNEELEKTSKIKSHFLSMISHEVRTPLHTVIGACELLLYSSERRSSSSSGHRLSVKSDDSMLSNDSTSSSSSSPTVSHISTTSFSSPPKPRDVPTATASGSNHSGGERKYDKSLLYTILRSANVLLQNLNSMLDLTKIEIAKADPTQSFLLKELFSFEELLRDISLVVEAKASKKRIDFLVKIDQRLTNTKLLGDVTRLKQVLLNLLSNSVKFTDSGSIELSIRNATPSITTTYQKVLFTVKDTGCGIPEYFRHNVFDAFAQAESGISRRYGGTGLGLAIVKRVVDLMGGTIDYQSDSNGTTFYMELPFEIAGPGAIEKSMDKQLSPRRHSSPSISIRRSDQFLEKLETEEFEDHDYDTSSDEESPMVSTPSHPAMPLFIPRTRVLIVDDNLINIKVLSKMLTHFGVHSAFVTSGFDALTQIQQSAFDIVVMDIEMPVMNGLETAQKMREYWSQKPPNQYVTIWYLSGTEKSSFTEEQLQDGDLFLQKPLKLKELQECLEKWAEENGQT